MEIKAKKPVIGLLGGIGSGKSTVAMEFAKLGCAVINADEIAHEILEEKDVREQITAIFGKYILRENKSIDRRKLAQIAFASADNIRILNEFTHQPVMERVEVLITRFQSENGIKGIILDIPLLAEVGWAGRCDKLIFVDCSLENRIARAGKRGITAYDIKIRENFQISLDTKAGMADNIVDNNSGFSAMAKQVEEIFSEYCN